MHFSAVFVVTALVAPILAAPAPLAQSGAEASSIIGLASRMTQTETVTCIPSSNKSKVSKFKVGIAWAKKQATDVGFERGMSGDPHEYRGRDGIVWRVKECDVKGAPLWEYPVFWKGTKGKDVKTYKQKMKTPLRAVYVNQNSGVEFCGIMTHSEVDDDF
ncbi:hypothetical protein GQ44DRAFT_735783 [Phaeosphaeriaceae sp. PMI808]|nr:hypothetical protein GQ44DRAFT_735783 [Phaeosphaeriaceae sp. PMI808]